ncbi:MAG: WG repeat-containing protein [Lachnospiraceae bacterium]|nr:WG repeat-containing protein [Lachnospiraceae bacterium]
MYTIRKKIMPVIALAALLMSCGHKYSADDYLHVDEFRDGIAIANLPQDMARDGQHLLINEKYEPVSRRFTSLFQLDHGFHYGRIPGSDSLIFISPDLKEYAYPSSSYTVLISKLNENKSIWIEDLDKKIMLIDVTDGTVLSPIYENTLIEQELPNGTVVLRHYIRGGYKKLWDYAIVDCNGKELAPVGKYTFVGDFHNGLARYSTSGYGQPKIMHENLKDNQLVDYYQNTKRMEITQGYINEKGDVVIPEAYQYAEDFKDDGTARVGFNNFYGKSISRFKIDRKGNKITD